MEISAKHIAKKARPGQFVILRADEFGERIPLTIADFDAVSGTVSIIFQVVGHTTMLLSELNAGERILDLVGPLGKASRLEGYKSAAVIGGGVGCAIAYPQTKHLYELGARVDLIAGFRTKDLIILEDEMRNASANLFVCTDDGSNGNKGLVTEQLKSLIDSGQKYDLVLAIGPLIMMKFVCALTKEYGIKTIVSMNPIMLDGTGMCGCCRVSVSGERKFACVDGPDFDGHEVDFDEVMKRNRMYETQEKAARENHTCRLTGEIAHE